MNISKETILRLSEEYLWGFDNKDMTFGDELGRTGEDLRSSKNASVSSQYSLAPCSQTSKQAPHPTQRDGSTFILE